MRFALLFFVVLVLAGCASTGGTAEQPAPEILRMPADCQDAGNQTMKKCCEEACTQYCQEEGMVFFKATANQVTCPCWCSLK